MKTNSYARYKEKRRHDFCIGKSHTGSKSNSPRKGLRSKLLGPRIYLHNKYVNPIQARYNTNN